jgi:Leucine-rich repeat (LRR) protein
MSIPDYTITELNLSYQNLDKLPDDIHKYTNLIRLYCSHNKLTNLDNLPLNLEILNCSINKLTSLDNLPPNLKKLYCHNNPLIYDFDPTLENIKNYNASRIQ